jgi:hypothetical protein
MIYPKTSHDISPYILWMVEKSESPVENGGKHPIILFGFQPSQIGGAGFRNHPPYLYIP